MDADFMDQVERLRVAVGFPLQVSSAFRCPDHNAAISSTGRDGPHTTGRAIDLRVYGAHAHTLLEAALALDFTGVGIAQRSRDRRARFIHLDDLTPDDGHPSRPWVWSY